MSHNPCTMHGCDPCAICHKPAGVCDYGICRNPAQVDVESSRANGTPFERRPLCGVHAKRVVELNGRAWPSRIVGLVSAGVR